MSTVYFVTRDGVEHILCVPVSEALIPATFEALYARDDVIEVFRTKMA